jgi:hypothetical protein
MVSFSTSFALQRRVVAQRAVVQRVDRALVLVEHFLDFFAIAPAIAFHGGLGQPRCRQRPWTFDGAAFAEARAHRCRGSRPPVLMPPLPRGSDRASTGDACFGRRAAAADRRRAAGDALRGSANRAVRRGPRSATLRPDCAARWRAASASCSAVGSGLGSGFFGTGFGSGFGLTGSGFGASTGFGSGFTGSSTFGFTGGGGGGSSCA